MEVRSNSRLRAKSENSKKPGEHENTKKNQQKRRKKRALLQRDTSAGSRPGRSGERSKKQGGRSTGDSRAGTHEKQAKPSKPQQHAQAHTNGHSTQAQPTHNNGTTAQQHLSTTQSSATDHTPQDKRTRPALVHKKRKHLSCATQHFVFKSFEDLRCTTLPPAWLLVVECCFAADQELPELWSL